MLDHLGFSCRAGKPDTAPSKDVYHAYLRGHLQEVGDAFQSEVEHLINNMPRHVLETLANGGKFVFTEKNHYNVTIPKDHSGEFLKELRSSLSKLEPSDDEFVSELRDMEKEVNDDE